MGNRQSVTITHQKEDHDGKQVKKDEANGHAMSGLDLTDAVTCEASVQQNTEPPPVTFTINVNPTPASVEANGTQAKAPTVSVEAAGVQVSATTVSAEQQIPAESSTPVKDAPKQAETPTVFSKMFKKKTGPVSAASEANVAAEVQIIPAVETESQKSKPTPASVEANGTQAKAPTVSVEAAGVQVSATTVSAEQQIPTESSTPVKDAPKQAETPTVFSKMFKKKTGPVSAASEANVAAEVQIVPAVETESQKSKPTSVSVEPNGAQAKAPTVSVEAAGVQVSATTVSAEQKIPAESSTPAKDAPKQAETPTVFSKMFKKKTGPVFAASEANVTAEVQIVPAVETESQKSKPTPASVEANGTQAKAPTVSVEAAGVQVSATTVSAEQKIPAESSTPAKDAPKQAETPTVFSKMFRKKTGLVFPASEANVAAEVQIVPAVETESQKSKPTPASVEANGTQAKAPTVSVEAAGVQVSATTVSAEQKNPAESSTPAKDAPKQVFSKMFRKKTGLVFPASEANVTAEVQIIPAVETESQKSKPTPASVEPNGAQAKAPTVSVEAAGVQVSATTVSAEQQIPAESSTPVKDAPKQAETPTVFSKMFKKKTGPVSAASEANVAAEVQIVPAVETESQKSKQTPVSVEVDGTQAKAPTVSVEAAGVQVSATTVSAEQKIPAESSTPAKDAPKQVFSKMFKKKTGLVFPASEANVAAEVQIVPAVETESQKSEPTDIKASTQAEKEPQGKAPKPSTTEVTQDSTQTEQTSTEETSVMNFFKTLVTSTKTTKEAAASPDVSKEQSQKETPPAPAANVQEASKIPPPPPPAPPKMESKAEPAVKKEEAPPVEVAAAAAKEPETTNKAKTKDSAFGKLFRTKALLGKKVSKGQVSTAGGARVPAKTSSGSGVKEEAKPVEMQVDASKTSTLEASAKSEPPPAPKPEEKKAEKKPSPFANLLKPKVLLGQVSSKIHAAASSAAAGISLGAGGAATESKKEAPAAPTAPAEAAPSPKTKEEPKAAAAAAPAAASADNKSVGSTDNSSPSTSRKLEKRNSIQLFFKNLGQKRHSDAGVQTEPAAPEKAK